MAGPVRPLLACGLMKALVLAGGSGTRRGSGGMSAKLTAALAAGEPRPCEYADQLLDPGPVGDHAGKHVVDEQAAGARLGLIGGVPTIAGAWAATAAANARLNMR